MKEERAVSALQKGSTAALEWLLRRYQKYVSTVIYNVLGPNCRREDVEELTSDVFLAIWRHGEKLPAGKLKSYIGAMARNQAKSFLRKQRPLVMDVDCVDLPDAEYDMEEAVIHRERKRRLKQAVEAMPQPDREIFLRYYYYFQTTEEISQAVGMDPGTLRVHLSRGRAKLKKTLGEEENR